ncbi:MAG: TonB-dependent receptor [Cyanobacteria bacterium P01_C01_bin.118]
MKIQVKWIAYILLISLFSAVSARSVSALALVSQDLTDLEEVDLLSQLPAEPDNGETDEDEDDVEEEDADEEDSDTLRIVVTATRREQSVLEVPRSITVIDRDDIEQQLNFTNNLPDLLGRLVPGLSPPTFNGSTSEIQLRGRSVVILVDGVPQTPNANTSAADLRVIDPSLIERIEILRGPSAVYGDGGTGGVINIITRRSEDDEDSVVYELDFKLGTSLNPVQDDSFFYNGRFGVSGSDGRADGRIDLSYDVRQSRFDGNGNRIIPTDITDTDRLGLLVKTGYNFDDEQRLELTYNFYRDTQNTDFTFDDSISAIPGLQTGVPLFVGDVDFEEQPEKINHIVNLTYSHDDILASDLDVQLYYRDQDLTQTFIDLRQNFLSTLPIFEPFPDIFQTSLKSEEFGGRLQLDTPLGESASLLWGIDYADESNARPVLIGDTVAFDADRQLNVIDRSQTQGGDYSLESVGLFAQGSWDISDQWQISGGVRYENFDVSVDDTELAFVTTPNLPRFREGGAISTDDVVFNAGLIYRPIPEIGLFANFAQGFSIPDVSFITGNAAATFDINDILLEAQKVDNYEIGIRAEFDRIQATLSGFYNESELGTNIVVDVDGFPAPVRAPQRNYGVEATVDWQPSDIWRLGGLFSWNEGDSDIDDDGDFQPLSSFDVSPFKLGLYVENDTTPGWTNRLELLAVGSRDRAADDNVPGEVPIDGYVTLDFLSSLKLGDGTLSLGVSNLLNNQYLPVSSQVLTASGVEPRRAAAPGRAITLGYSVRF